MAEKILFVDDDANILNGFQRNLRNRFSVVVAESADRALETLKKDSSFAVIVSDFRMPAMNGVQFFSRTSAEWPDCVRVLLTGEADTRAAAAAINQGNIFRYLAKPCPALTLEKTLEEAVKHHTLITAERVLLKRTLRGSMEVLTEVLNLVHPVAFSRSNRICHIVQQILPSIDTPNKWEFEIAAMLSHIGCITVPFQILDKVRNGHDLSKAEHAIYWSHPETGRLLLEKIPHLELVAQIIGNQAQPLKPIAAWQQIETADRLTLGSHLLRLALEVEEGTSKRLNKAAIMAGLRSKSLHPALLKVLEGIDSVASKSMILPSSELTCGMILDNHIIGENGLLLMAKGQFLSATLIQYLRRRFEYSGVEEPIQVRVPEAQAAASE